MNLILSTSVFAVSWSEKITFEIEAPASIRGNMVLLCQLVEGYSAYVPGLYRVDITGLEERL